MKVLVTGAGGQLGREAISAFQGEGREVIGIKHSDLDYSQPDLVAEGIASHNADWVINCAAYTQVDKAEDESNKVFLINRDSARAVAEGVQSTGGKLLHVSTDFIFDGKQSHPYSEDDVANPLGVYGQSKWEGEQAVLEILPEAIILRTAWVYGVNGNNFVKTMLRLSSQHEELRVVDDQIGTPSWTLDIVHAMDALMNKGANGVFHFTNEGVASWYDFVIAIIKEGKSLGFPIKTKRIVPIPTEDYPTPAIRPAYSVLSKKKIREQLAFPIPHWEESLRNMLRSLKNNTEGKVA